MAVGDGASCSSSRPGSSRCPRRPGSAGTATVATPEPPSAEFDVSATVPRTFGGVGRAVIVPVGSVLSTRTWIVAGAASALPAASVVKTRRS